MDDIRRLANAIDDIFWAADVHETRRCHGDPPFPAEILRAILKAKELANDLTREKTA